MYVGCDIVLIWCWKYWHIIYLLIRNIRIYILTWTWGALIMLTELYPKFYCIYFLRLDLMRSRRGICAEAHNKVRPFVTVLVYKNQSVDLTHTCKLTFFSYSIIPYLYFCLTSKSSRLWLLLLRNSLYSVVIVTQRLTLKHVSFCCTVDIVWTPITLQQFTRF